MYPGEQLWFYNAETTLKPWWEVEEAIEPFGDPEVTLSLEVGEILTAVSTDPGLLRPEDVLEQCNWILSAPAPFAARVTVGTTTDGSTFTWSSPADITVPAGRSHLPVPAGQANTAAMLSGSYQAIRVEALAAGVLTDCYLQIEPPEGLQVQVGQTWSDWLTPEILWRRAAQRTLTDEQAWGYSGVTAQEGSNDDAPDMSDHIESAYTQSLATASPVTVGPAIDFILLSANQVLDIEAEYQLGNPPFVDIYDWSAEVLAGGVVQATAHWISGSTSTRTPYELADLQFGRDYVDWEFIPGGTTNAVSWVPFYWAVDVSSLEDGNPVAPAQEFSASLVGASAGGDESHYGAGRRFFLTEPPPGDYTVDVVSSFFSVQEIVASAGYGFGAGRVNSLSRQVLFRSFNSDGEGGSVTPLQMDCQLPDYRIAVPVWGPSPDAVIPNPIDPPLRQVQRDDNANGFSAARWLPSSSQQTSNRWIGYL